MREIPIRTDGAARHLRRRRARMQPHYVASLSPGAEKLAAIEPLTDLQPSPYLVIRVNGVRIAARGGNWGMDDFRKRVSREHLEPFFRLNRDAHLNIIRNWVGQRHRRNLLRAGRRVRHDGLERLLGVHAELQHRSTRIRRYSSTTPATPSSASATIPRSSSGADATRACPSPSSTRASNSLINSLDGTRYYSPVPTRSTSRTAARTAIKTRRLLHHAESRIFGRDRHSFVVDPGVLP